MSAPTGRIRVGTSGWEYRHWVGPYYPEDLGPDRWLGHYAHDFDCVEVTSSFHELPDPALLDRWRESTPPGFHFGVRAPREITHRKKLKGCEDLVRATVTRLARLGDAAGPLLFRLPPRWHVSVRRLAEFLEGLPRDGRFAFEIPDRSWHVPEVTDLLARHDAALCVDDLDRRATALPATATGFVYVRLHGPVGGQTGNYRAERLRTWAGRATGWARGGRDVYLIFDDDERAWAARNARRLRTFLGLGAMA